jgi:hypothetical protein
MSLYRTPGPADRARIAADLRSRAALVRRGGWAEYAGVWSTGQVAAVRAVLGEAHAVAEACAALASSLWGIAGAEVDDAGGYPRTYAWLAEVGR